MGEKPILLLAILNASSGDSAFTADTHVDSQRGETNINSVPAPAVENYSNPLDTHVDSQGGETNINSIPAPAVENSLNHPTDSSFTEDTHVDSQRGETNI